MERNAIPASGIRRAPSLRKTFPAAETDSALYPPSLQRIRVLR